MAPRKPGSPGCQALNEACKQHLRKSRHALLLMRVQAARHGRNLPYVDLAACCQWPGHVPPPGSRGTIRGGQSLQHAQPNSLGFYATHGSGLLARLTLEGNGGVETIAPSAPLHMTGSASDLLVAQLLPLHEPSRSALWWVASLPSPRELPSRLLLQQQPRK